MKKDVLKQYLALRRSLETEKAQLEARLKTINETLSVATNTGASEPGRKRKKMSAAARAKISAGQTLRWAERKKANKK